MRTEIVIDTRQQGQFSTHIVDCTQDRGDGVSPFIDMELRDGRMTLSFRGTPDTITKMFDDLADVVRGFRNEKMAEALVAAD